MEVGSNSQASGFRHRAFISYSSKDHVIGEKFQRALEAYKIPRMLRGRQMASGPVPKRMTPIWRDRSDLEAGLLGPLIQQALQGSGALIVLCSPASAGSKWVNEEIRTFKWLGRGSRIITVLVDGTPTEYGLTTNPTGAFPAALMRKIGPDGAISDEPETEVPFSPDLREPLPDGSGGDGMGRVIEKVVAVLTGLSQGELSQCHDEAERHERRLQRWATIGALALATIAVIGGVAAFLQRQDALTSESRFLASKADELDVATQDHAAAMVIALDALPSGRGLLLPRPYVVAAERAFVTAATRNRLIHNLTGHKDQVREAHFSPDGRSIATASWDGTARLWKIDSCRDGNCPFVSFVGHTDGVNSIAFSSDGRRVVTASLDKTARVWDAKSGAIIAVLTGHRDRVTSAVFSPDRTHVATASWDNTVRLWNLMSCRSGACPSITMNADRSVGSVVFSSDGRYLAASTDNQTRVWSMTACSANGCPSIVLEGAKAVFSPDGFKLATTIFSFTEGHMARVWNLAACEQGHCSSVALRGHKYFLRSINFSPDGRRVVTAADDMTVRVWDLGNCPQDVCTATNVLEGHTDYVGTASFSPDGTHVISASGGFNAKTWDARVWDLKAVDCTYGRPCPPIILAGHAGWVYGAEFSPDETRAVTASSDGTARVWNVADCRDSACPARTFSANDAHILAVSPRFRSIVATSAATSVEVWETRRCNGAACHPLVLTGHDQIVSASFSPDGTKLIGLSLSADRGGPPSSQKRPNFEAQLWDLTACRRGSCVPSVMKGEMGMAPSSTIPNAVFSPDGRTVVLVSGERAYLARLSACDKVHCPSAFLSGHRDAINSVAYAPDGSVVATASNDTTTRIWRLSNCVLRSCNAVQILRGEPTTLQGGSPGPEAQNSVAFAPDAIHVVTAGGRVVRIWDLSACGSGNKCRSTVLEGHQDEVRSAVFSPDGMRIATVSEDKTARIWDLASCPGDMCRSLVLAGHLARVSLARFSPDGERVLTVSNWDGTARLWDATSGSELMVLGTLREPLDNAEFSADGTQLIAFNQKRAFVFHISYPFIGDAGQGRALSRSGCQAARDFGVLTATRFQREQALFLGDSVACNNYGVLSWQYYTQASESAWSWVSLHIFGLPQIKP